MEFGKSWKYVGIILGLKVSLLQTIELNEHNIADRAFNMLSEWLKRSDVCYCDLIYAMKEEGHDSGVKLLEQNIRRLSKCMLYKH